MFLNILTPCPFCNNELVNLITEDNSYAINCPGNQTYGCGATGGFAQTIEEAIIKWNKRNSKPFNVPNCLICKFDIGDKEACYYCDNFSEYQESTKSKNT